MLNIFTCLIIENALIKNSNFTQKQLYTSISKVCKLQKQHPNVCQAFPEGENEVKLIKLDLKNETLFYKPFGGYIGAF